jgi:PAS domain S-box-containing protein
MYQEDAPIPTEWPDLNVTSAPWGANPAPVTGGGPGHFVLFYENDSFLVYTVGAFMGAAFDQSDCGIIIGTDFHLLGFEERLKTQGHKLENMEREGRYFSFPADTLLQKVMVEGRLDENRFINEVTRLIAQATKRGRALRIYGELVNVLWAEGNYQAALRMEQLWDELGKRHDFSLLCGYRLGAFQSDGSDRGLMEICDAHSAVIPAESFSAFNNMPERLKAIALLQQKASCLSSEIAERKHAESSLRAEQTKLKMAVAMAGLGTWELDIATELLTCSEQSQSHLGSDRSEAVSFTQFFERVHEDDRELFNKRLQKAITDGMGFETEFRVTDSDGRVRWISLMCRRFQSSAPYLIGVTQDVTQRRRGTETLKETPQRTEQPTRASQ